MRVRWRLKETYGVPVRKKIVEGIKYGVRKGQIDYRPAVWRRPGAMRGIMAQVTQLIWTAQILW